MSGYTKGAFSIDTSTDRPEIRIETRLGVAGCRYEEVGEQEKQERIRGKIIIARCHDGTSFSKKHGQLPNGAWKYTSDQHCHRLVFSVLYVRLSDICSAGGIGFVCMKVQTIHKPRKKK